MIWGTPMLEQLSAIASKGVESISEAFKETAIQSLKEPSPLKASMEAIENTSIESLKAQNAAQIIDSVEIMPSETEGNDTIENEGLSEEERQQIKNETGWSDEIIGAIGSIKEYEIYKNAGLKEGEINGRKCLVRSDIDWEQKDSMGRTNSERAEAGLSPINKEGETIELHHIGQKSDGQLAELTPDEHRGKENYSVLHDSQKESEIDRVAFNGERSNHWNERSNAGVQNA